MADPGPSTTSHAAAPPDADPFYVGYRAVPRRDRLFLRFLVPGLLWLMVFVGFAIVWPRRSPGSGVWETGEAVERMGLLLAEPYPMLLMSPTRDASSVGSDGTPAARAVLLTEMGKLGAGARAAPFHGEAVRVRGFRLHRDGREILELVPDPDAIELDPALTDRVSLAEASGQLSMPPDGPLTVLDGEVLDSKCYLGAMKPGDGKGHKACAMLCIRGGIPPMLFARSPDGRPDFWLILNHLGMPINDEMIALAGEPVTARGRQGRIADLKVLFVEPDGLTRRN